MTLVICTVGGWHTPWDMPASLYLDRQWISGGERSLYELAAAAASLGHDVELRGDLQRRALDEICAAAGAAPRVGMPSRRPASDDLVVVPEGWSDPQHYARIALSPARAAIMLLAPPGLFGWPFVEGWTPPDPTAVPLDAVGRPEHYRGMTSLGFELWTNAPVLAAEAEAAGVACRMLAAGDPVPFPDPRPKRLDVAVIENNRWAPLARAALATLDATHVAIPTVDHDRMLELLSEARVLIWPSRIEGFSRMQTEARAMGTVPVALRSNRFGVGLSGEEGAVVVDDPDDIAPAVRALLDGPQRLEDLRERAMRSARAQLSWEPFVKRLAEALDAPWDRSETSGVRSELGAAIDRTVAGVREEAAARVDEVEQRFGAFRRRRAVRWAARVADALGPTRRRSG